MAQKKAYSRYFIILQQDENGYSLASDKLPSGYAKLEIKNDKCKISYYVQNLKKEMEPYHMALICNKKDVKKLIKLGNMNIDDFGRAEITFEYSVDNVAGSGVPADMISGAAIIKFVNSSIISVMSGFSTTDVPIGWKNYESFEISREEENREAEEAVEPAIEPVSEPSEEKPQEEKPQEEKPEERLQEETVPEDKVENISKVTEETREEKVAEEVILEEKNIFEEYEKKIDEVREQIETVEAVNVVQEEPQQENISEPEGVNEEKTESREEVSVPEENKEEDVTPEDNKEEENRKEDNLPEEQQEVVPEPVEEKADEIERSKEHKHHECKEEKCEKGKEKCEKEKFEKDKEKEKEDHPSGTVGDFFKALAEGFEEVKEGCKEIKRCKWYKIKVENMDDMCNTSDYNKYTLVYYPMISYYPYIKKHGHYLLGYKYDINGKMKYIVYGMPGTKSRLDQPYGGKSGFVTWVPFKEGDEAEDSFGYWLMFYDFRTSTIVIPVK